MIRIEEISKVFNPHSRNKNQVLKGVSFNLPDKGLICIYGKSGSGKTTLLNIIGGLDKQDKGSIYIDDELITDRNRDRIRNQKIGFVFQNYYLEAGYTIEEIIHNQMIIAGFKDEKEIKKRSKEVLELVDMERFKHKQGDALSGGQKQRVAIARGLVKGSNIILADEPTGNLDAENTMRIMDIFKEISKTKLVVIVTHEVTLIKKYADSYIQLVDGRLSDKDVIGEVFEYETKKNNIYIDRNEKKIINNGISEYGEGSLNEDDIQIFNKNGKTYLKASANVSILNDNSEKKIVFTDSLDELPLDIGKKVPSLERSKAKRNGKLFKLKNILKNRRGGDGAYSSANIFKQIFIVAIALVMAFFSLLSFDVLRINIDHKEIDQNKTYLDLNTFKDIKRFNPSIYDNVDFFESERRVGSFSYNDMTALSGIKCEYTPKAIDSDSNLKIIDNGRLPNDNEIMVSKGLAEEIKKELRLKELNNDKAIRLVEFEGDKRISGIVDEAEPIVYMNRAEYVNFLGVYDAVQFVDPLEIFFTKDYVNNTYRTEIVPFTEYEDIDKSEVEIQISRNALYKMMENTKDADYLIQKANSTLRANEGRTGLELKGSNLYVKKLSITRETIKTDLRIYVHPEALKNIFVYLEPNIDTLTANSSSKFFFEISTSSSEQQKLLDEKLNERRISKVDVNKIYEVQGQDMVNESIRSLSSFLIIMVLLFFIYYFMEKSGSIKNSKEYGIYRAIGVNRSNLLFKEMVNTIMSNIITYLFAYIIVISLMAIRYSIMNIGFGMFILIALGVFIITMLIMVGISLIPYLFVVRETPSKILSRYDI